MARSRSRERRNKSREKSRDRRSRSRSYRERRRSRDRDYRRRDKSIDRYSSRDKKDKLDKRRSRDRSYERYRNKSSERDRRRRSHDSRSSKRQRSTSSDRKTSHSSKSQSETVKPIVIIASTNKKSSKNRNANNESNSTDHRASFEISNEFSQEGFEQFSRDHGIDFTNIETDEDREVVHEKMEELLKAHFAAQGKVYPPPKQEKPVVNNVTGFANDGSFLEQFKKMQEEYKQQQETEKKRAFENSFLKNLPINKRRGAKILKTGLVAKTIVTNEGTITTNSFDSYYKEVQKYKSSSSCDSDSKNRPLVK